MTVTHLIHAAAASPLMEGNAQGLCRACGLPGVGLPFSDWVRDTFTDHDKLKPGTIVCHACQFCFTDRCSLLTYLTGKEKLQRMRNYSHFVTDGQWLPLSKGEKPMMRELLLHRAPRVAVIADAGQKHIIFRSRPGWWQFEEQTLRPDPGELSRQLERISELYIGGFAKSEIGTGRYQQGRILAFGYPRWEWLESALRPERGSALFSLALFLAQKEDDDTDN